jgi:hypothetical protein
VRDPRANDSEMGVTRRHQPDAKVLVDRRSQGIAIVIPMARFQAHLMPGRSPIPGGMYDLARLGYEEREYTVTGTARSWRMTGERSLDGRWAVEPSDDAAFVTRILVRVPTESDRFSGTVAVEWNNVSGGIDVGPDWMLLHRDLIREGHAWVGVTAQKAGIDGGGLVEGFHLKLIDAARYRPLDHPGDAWSYDIFTGVGELLRSDNSPIAPLAMTNLIGVGESQSAAFLVTYINAIDPIDATYDGFFVHGRPGTGAGITGFDIVERAANGGRPRPMDMSPERIRDDARVPVFVLQSETDVIVLGGGRPEQPDGLKLRQWEIAGAAHADTYLLGAAFHDDGNLTPNALATHLRPTTDLPTGQVDSPVNSGPQQHYVGQAAFEHLVRWVGGGDAPPAAPRLQTEDGCTRLALDDHGFAIGGLRTPWVDTPVARLSGLGQDGDSFAFLFGRTESFTSEELDRRYPGGQDEYLARFQKDLDRSIQAGHVLDADRDEILALAAAAWELLER